jgi:probable F420-dependent oxidoreductase
LDFVTKPKFGLRLLNFGLHARREAITQQAKLADDSGYYSVWVAERILVPFPPNQPWSKESPLSYEMLTVLSYLAGITENVKLGTNILITPLRNPVILAREVATLDVLSKGRVILGLGLGWMREEFDALKVPLKERGSRTEESIAILRELWEKDRPSFRKGRFTRFGDVLFEPKPVQRHLPIWIGGETVPALKRVARVGDGWLPSLKNGYEEMKSCINTIKTEAKNRGRSMDEITITHRLTLGSVRSERSSTLKMIEKMHELGAEHYIVDFEHKSAPEYAEKAKLFNSEIMKCF